jgi:hypothetical protein
LEHLIFLLITIFFLFFLNSKYFFYIKIIVLDSTQTPYL